MVRSLSIHNGAPFQPTRRCAMSGVRPESRDTAIALPTSTGLATVSSATDVRRSQSAIARQVRSLDGCAVRGMGMEAKRKPSIPILKGTAVKPL